MKIKIEQLSTEYIDQVAGLFNNLVIDIRNETNDAYFQFDNFQTDKTKKMLEGNIEDDCAAIYVALDDKTPIGFIGGQIQSNFLPFSNISKVGYITGAYVNQSYRRKGIMKLLEGTLLEFFKAKFFSFMDWAVHLPLIIPKSHQ